MNVRASVGIVMLFATLVAAGCSSSRGSAGVTCADEGSSCTCPDGRTGTEVCVLDTPICDCDEADPDADRVVEGDVAVDVAGTDVAADAPEDAVETDDVAEVEGETGDTTDAEAPDAAGEDTDADADAGGVDVCWGPTCEPPPDMVAIPEGDVTAGSPEDELARESDEDPVEVEITRPFAMGETEVTESHWARVMGLPEPPQDELRLPHIDTWLNWLEFANRWSEQEGLAPCYRIEPGPVVTVLAPGGVPAACEGYRLPTAAEWEHAFRAGTNTAFFSGDIGNSACEEPHLNAYAWYCGTNGPDRECCREVGQLAPNPWGLYDIAGNTPEFVFDGYIEDRGEGGPDFFVPPPGPGNRVEYRNCTTRAHAHYCRAAQRDWREPDALGAGARLVRTSPTHLE